MSAFLNVSSINCAVFNQRKQSVGHWMAGIFLFSPWDFLAFLFPRQQNTRGASMARHVHEHVQLVYEVLLAYTEGRHAAWAASWAWPWLMRRGRSINTPQS